MGEQRQRAAGSALRLNWIARGKASGERDRAKANGGAIATEGGQCGVPRGAEVAETAAHRIGQGEQRAGRIGWIGDGSDEARLLRDFNITIFSN